MAPPQTYLLHLLLHRAHWMSERVYEKAAHNGYGDVTPAMGRLFELVVGGPIALSELARRLSVSRQAVHKLANEAAALGYVEMMSSSDDARIKLLRFTNKGKAMARSAERELIRIEADLQAVLGTKSVDELKRLLAKNWERT